MESLARRVNALAKQLCGPINEGDVKEKKRRERLEE